MSATLPSGSGIEVCMVGGIVAFLIKKEVMVG